MKIYINGKDVTRAKQATKDNEDVCATCPTAQALIRYFPKRKISVGTTIATVWSKSGKTCKTYLLSKKLSDTIEKWDDKGIKFPVGHYNITEKKRK